MTAAARIAKGRAALLLREPFWGVLALQLNVVERPDVETMASDGASLFYCPAFVSSLSESELVGVLAHEVEHVARLHVTRRGTRDPKQWNIACDHAINPGLVAAGFRLPKGALYDRRFAGQAAETIYAALIREADAKGRPQPGQPGNGQPQPGNGQPQSGQGDPGGCGGVMDAPAATGRDNMEADIQARVRQAAGLAKRAGKLPGSAIEALATLDVPAVSWRDVLRRFADASALRDVSWVRPSRRGQGGGVILPGMASIAPAHLVCVIDTSGSMDKRALSAVGGELQSILDDGGADMVTVVQCDTAVRAVASYTGGDVLDLAISGRGGTAFAPAFEWVGENAPDASAVIYLTDMDSDRWGEPPACPVLWAATERPRPAPFGEIIAVDAHA